MEEKKLLAGTLFTELAVFEPNIHPSDTPNFLLNSGSIYTLRLALRTRPSSLARDVRA